MTWPDSVDFKKEVFCCVKCKGEITDEDRVNGLWVAKYSKRETNGYWLSQMFCIWHSAKEIIAKEKKYKRDVFYNFTLGLAYEGSDVNVKKQHIYRCLSNNPPIADTPLTMGIDQGATFYITVGGVDGIHRMYIVDSWDKVETEIARYNPEICVIDGLPETNQVKKLQKKFGNTRVFPAFYKDKPDDPRTVRWERQTTDRRTSAVYIDRFRSIDDLVHQIYKGEIVIRMTEGNPNIHLVIKHFESIYRTEDTNKTGQTFYVWKSSNKQDHFVHSMNYWLVAMERISHLKKMNIEDGEDKRPHSNYETPDERLERLDREYFQATGDMPEYLESYLEGRNDT
jgi:hypothetical protein